MISSLIFWLNNECINETKTELNTRKYEYDYVFPPAAP